MITLAIVEDDRKLRRDLTELLGFYDEFSIVGSFGSGEEALRHLSRQNKENIPDVYLMDIQLPGMSGIEATRQIKICSPATEVIILTVYDDDVKVFNSIKSGASGYVLKGASPDEIAQAVKDVIDGGSPISQKVARKVLDYIKTGGATKSAEKMEDLGITRREKEILMGMAAGETYLSLAKKLCISPHTVRTHIKNIYEKLHVHTSASAVKKAIERKII
ncbi:MAG: response regulator transcription factor [FCB group bacterium]|nr:response regulator transcription factor [FCB group bacterium]